MEENLSSKMEEFMSSLDQVKKYREIVASMTDFALIISGSIVAALSIYIFYRLYDLFIGYVIFSFVGFVSPILSILTYLVGIVMGIFWVRRRMKSVKVGQWKSTLSEGAPGAIKLLQNLEWEKIFSDIRSAKLGFSLYGIFKILAYWTLTAIFLFVLSGFVEFVLHMSINSITVMLFSLVVVLLLSRNDLRKRYEQIGRLDWLMWELRWFESEFRGANFEA
jgi:hypothetical protein